MHEVGYFRLAGADVPCEVPRPGACTEALSRSLASAVAEASKIYVQNNFIGFRKRWKQPWVQVSGFLLKAELGSHLCSDSVELSMNVERMGSHWVGPEVLEVYHHSRNGSQCLKGVDACP